MKKKHPEHVNLERWLVSYADFITLLFAFFVVMYSIANQDKAKIKQIVESIERSFFGASGKLDLGTGDSVNIMTNPSSLRGNVIDQEMGRTDAVHKSTDELVEIAERIEESISYQFQTTDLKDTLEMVYDDRGLVIRMAAHKLFEDGSEVVRLRYLPLIDKITEVVSDTKRLIRIEGHTASTEKIISDKFPTIWELSAGRAAWIARYIRAKHGFPTRRLSAAGYADGHPLATNDTEVGQEKNRRIEVVVTNIKDKQETQQ